MNILLCSFLGILSLIAIEHGKFQTQHHAVKMVEWPKVSDSNPKPYIKSLVLSPLKNQPHNCPNAVVHKHKVIQRSSEITRHTHLSDSPHFIIKTFSFLFFFCQLVKS